MKARGRSVLTARTARTSTARTALNHLYVALVAPLGELAGRLGWGVLIVIGLILTYALCYNIWSSFAFPFYLDFLHYIEGRGRLRIEGVRHLHDDVRNQPRRLSVRSDRAPADDPDRRDPAGLRQLRLRRPCRGRPHLDAVAGAIGLNPVVRPVRRSTSGW